MCSRTVHIQLNRSMEDRHQPAAGAGLTIQGDTMLDRITERSKRATARISLVVGTTAAMLALGAVGATGASAAPSCEGSDITGGGAAAQGIAQQDVWNPGFAADCAGGPTVSYDST